MSQSSSPSKPVSDPSAFPKTKHRKIINFNLRPAGPEDIPTMAQQQCTMAFETEGRRMTPDEHVGGLSLGVLKNRYSFVQLFVAEAQLEKNQEDEIDEEEENDNNKMQVCGMCMIRPEFSLLRNSSVYSIEDVYTEEKFRSKGVWRRCFEALLEKRVLASNGLFSGMRLFVNYKNDVAIAAYKRVGMYLEHGRPFRWCQEKCEAPREDLSEEDVERMKITALSTRPNEAADKFAQKCVQRLILSSNEIDESNKDLIEQLVSMIWFNAKTFNRFANDLTGGLPNEFKQNQKQEESNFEKKFNFETLREGVKKAVQSTTGVVTNKTCTERDLASEFYIIRDDEDDEGKRGITMACFCLTFELCTWRQGFILWIQNFSVAEAFIARRGEIFRSVIRHFQRVVETQSGEEAEERILFAGVRYELDPEVEAEEKFGKENNLVKVSEEEAFEFEEDLLMRVEAPHEASAF